MEEENFSKSDSYTYTADDAVRLPPRAPVDSTVSGCASKQHLTRDTCDLPGMRTSSDKSFATLEKELALSREFRRKKDQRSALAEGRDTGTFEQSCGKKGDTPPALAIVLPDRRM